MKDEELKFEEIEVSHTLGEPGNLFRVRLEERM
jgi:hypothetical protein